MRTLAIVGFVLATVAAASACGGGRHPPQINTARGALLISGVETADEYPPGSFDGIIFLEGGTRLLPASEAGTMVVPAGARVLVAEEGQKLLVLHLEEVGDHPTRAPEEEPLPWRDAYLVASDGSGGEYVTFIVASRFPTRDITGSEPVETDVDVDLALVFSVGWAAEEFTLYFPGNAPVVLPRPTTAATAAP